MRIIIQHITGGDAGRRDVLLLDSDPAWRISIGRAEDCTVRLDLHRDLEVSSHHAEIYLDPERGLRIRDLESTNGLLVEGERTTDAPLPSGATVELGSGGVKLRIRLRKSLMELLTGRNPATPAKPSSPAGERP